MQTEWTWEDGRFSEGTDVMAGPLMVMIEKRFRIAEKYSGVGEVARSGERDRDFGPSATD